IENLTILFVSVLNTHLSALYMIFWSGRADLNGRPLAPQASTLPGCATPRRALCNSTVSCIVHRRPLECNRLGRDETDHRQLECDSTILRIAWRFPRSFCASSLGRTRWLATRPRRAQYRLTPASVCPSS